jgi:hypothetical protein
LTSRAGPRAADAARVASFSARWIRVPELSAVSLGSFGNIER